MEMREFAGWVLLFAALVAVVAAPRGQRAEAAAAGEGSLRAGAAAVKITPALDRTVFIAGYDQNRVANSVHDDLWARALVLDDGKTRFAVVACDLIGLSNYRVRLLREAITAVPKENILITCTHVHSGPDTLGLWGKGLGSTGLDPEYLKVLQERVAEAVAKAAGALQPVTLAAGKTVVPDGLVYNSREAIQDKELTSLRLTGADGRTVATVIHYGGHPEVNKTKALTSDFVGYVRDAAEKRYGGTALFLNGALGGMVTPKISEHNFAEMERVGVGVGKAAVAALEAARPVADSQITIRRRDVTLPLGNDKFQLLLGLKVLDAPPNPPSETSLSSEVWRVDIGPITWMTIPGEILPKPALALKALLPGPYPMVVALGNDELGYILEPEDFDRALYSYEKSMSVGKETWPLLFAAAKELLK